MTFSENSEAQIQTVPHLKRPAQNREGNDPKIGLIEHHKSANYDPARKGFDLRRNLKGMHRAMERDRDDQLRPIGNCAGYENECKGEAPGIDDFLQHIVPRAFDSLLRKLREPSFRAQPRLVYGKPIKWNVEVRSTTGHVDIASHVMACDHMIVPQAGKRSTAAYVDNHERTVRIDAQHFPAKCFCLPVIGRGKVRRRLLHRSLRGNARSAARHQACEDYHKAGPADISRPYVPHLELHSDILTDGVLGLDRDAL